MSSSNRDIRVHGGLLVALQASRCCPVSSTVSATRYKEPPGSTLVIVHFCPVHFWTVSSKPNSLSLLSTSSRHRFDFLFCMEPLCMGRKTKKKEKEKKDLFHSILCCSSTSFQIHLEISACGRVTGSQTLQRASHPTPFTPKRRRGRGGVHEAPRRKRELRKLLRQDCISNKSQNNNIFISISIYPLPPWDPEAWRNGDASDIELKPNTLRALISHLLTAASYWPHRRISCQILIAAAFTLLFIKECSSFSVLIGQKVAINFFYSHVIITNLFGHAATLAKPANS